MSEMLHRYRVEVPESAYVAADVRDLCKVVAAHDREYLRISECDIPSESWQHFEDEFGKHIYEGVTSDPSYPAMLAALAQGQLPQFIALTERAS